MSSEDAVPADAIRPGLAFVYAASAELAAPIPIGETPDGMRRIIPILSGTVEGPHIRGRILGGGSDWQLLRSDGVTVADATYGIETDDGTIIQIRNRGLRPMHGSIAASSSVRARAIPIPSGFGSGVSPDRDKAYACLAVSLEFNVSVIAVAQPIIYVRSRAAPVCPIFPSRQARLAWSAGTAAAP